MAPPERKQAATVRIPLSLLFFTTGAILLLTAGAIYGLTRPRQAARADLPGLIPLAHVPTPTRRPPPTTAVGQVANLPGAPASSPQSLQLLPESPPGEALPSEARADQAPRALLEPRPGQPLRIVIPSLDLDAPVWPVGLEALHEAGQPFYRWQVPNAYAAGWHEDSALLGQPGNTVLNGHHNIYGEIFRDLHTLQRGDEILLYDAERSYRYTIVGNRILRERDQPLYILESNARWIAPTRDERLTLVTCWPYEDNTHRVIIIAIPQP